MFSFCSECVKLVALAAHPGFASGCPAANMLAMNATVTPPSKAERIEMYRSASWPQRLAVHEAIAACKREAMEARRALGRRYLERHPGGAVVPYETGSLALELVSETAAAREEIGRASCRERV